MSHYSEFVTGLWRQQSASICPGKVKEHKSDQKRRFFTVSVLWWKGLLMLWFDKYHLIDFLFCFSFNLPSIPDSVSHERVELNPLSRRNVADEVKGGDRAQLNVFMFSAATASEDGSSPVGVCVTACLSVCVSCDCSRSSCRRWTSRPPWPPALHVRLCLVWRWQDISNSLTYRSRVVLRSSTSWNSCKFCSSCGEYCEYRCTSCVHWTKTRRVSLYIPSARSIRLCNSRWFISGK